VLQADLMLNDVVQAPPEQQREFATTAMQAAERALRRRPDDVAAGSLQAIALALMGKPKEARTLSDHLLQQSPADWRARAGRSELESIVGDDFEALRWLRPAVESNPMPYLRARQTLLIERIYQRIRTELADHQWATARRDCERLIEIAPEEIEARTTRVDTFTLEGDLPHALEECRKLYGERPHDRAIVQRLASLYDRLGQPQEALEFKRILLSLPNERTPPR
jgi:predicted Zn-dependent protease